MSEARKPLLFAEKEAFDKWLCTIFAPGDYYRTWHKYCIVITPYKLDLSTVRQRLLAAGSDYATNPGKTTITIQCESIRKIIG